MTHNPMKNKGWKLLRSKWGKGATRANKIFIHTFHPKHKPGLDLVSIEDKAKMPPQEERSIRSKSTNMSE